MFWSSTKKKNMSKNRKYTITLTEHQMMLIADCVEDIHRFLAGQTELANATLQLNFTDEVRDSLKRLQSLVTPELPMGESYAWNGATCPNEHQRKMIAETYYLYCEMLHQYYIANGLSNVYSTETMRCEESEEPIKITWE